MSVRTSSLVAAGLVTLAVLGGVTIFGGTIAALVNPVSPATAPAVMPNAVSPAPAAPPPSSDDAGAAPTTKDGSS